MATPEHLLKSALNNAHVANFLNEAQETDVFIREGTPFLGMELSKIKEIYREYLITDNLEKFVEPFSSNIKTFYPMLPYVITNLDVKCPFCRTTTFHKRLPSRYPATERFDYRCSTRNCEFQMSRDYWHLHNCKCKECLSSGTRAVSSRDNNTQDEKSGLKKLDKLLEINTALRLEQANLDQFIWSFVAEIMPKLPPLKQATLRAYLNGRLSSEECIRLLEIKLF